MLLLATTVTTTAAGAPARLGTDLAHYVSQVNWAAPTWDLFIVLFFVATVFLYGLSLGRDRIIVILMSIYMALAVVSVAPFLGEVNADVAIGKYLAFKVTAFLGIFVLLFFLLSRSVLLKTFGNLAAGKWWQVLIFSAFHVGLLVSITISLLPTGALAHLAPLTKTLFASETAKFVWVVAPIGAMAFLSGGDE